MTRRHSDPKFDRNAARKAVGERFAKLKESLEQAQEINRQRREKLFPKKATKGRHRATLIFLLVVAVLFIARCSCTPPEHPQTQAPPQPLGSKAPVFRSGRPALSNAQQGQEGELRRGEFTARDQGAPEWFEVLRRQVLARSPRLADCFKGAERGGGVRWSATFNPVTGRVSDHSLLLINTTVTLLEEQESCLIDVLSSPQYAPVVGESGGSSRLPSQPLQIHMVIEF